MSECQFALNDNLLVLRFQGHYTGALFWKAILALTPSVLPIEKLSRIDRVLLDLSDASGGDLDETDRAFHHFSRQKLRDLLNLPEDFDFSSYKLVAATILPRNECDRDAHRQRWNITVRLDDPRGNFFESPEEAIKYLDLEDLDFDKIEFETLKY